MATAAVDRSLAEQALDAALQAPTLVHTVVAPARRRRRGRAAVVRATTFVCWLAGGLVIGLALLLSAPTIAGYRTLTVLSGSMAPTLPVGSIVLSDAIPAAHAQPGQIITFSDPTRGGELVSHRLLRMSVHKNTAHMVTRGDANGASEEWSVPANGIIGRVEYRVPFVGYVKAKLDMTAVRLAVLAMLGISALVVLIEIWRPKRRRSD